MSNRNEGDFELRADLKCINSQARHRISYKKCFRAFIKLIYKEPVKVFTFKQQKFSCFNELELEKAERKKKRLERKVFSEENRLL